jgi:spore coat polysaccharide biosynthesis predicted glycosyltransferase SpsG
LIVPAALNSLQEVQYLDDLMALHYVDCIVLDGYQFDQAYRKGLAKLDRVFTCFDDTNQSGSLPVDMIINGAANAHTLGYEKTAPSALLCTGEKYRILRQEFVANTMHEDRNNWPDRHRLTIVMGGSDPLDITRKLLNELQERDLHHVITVVIGAAYPWQNELKTFIQRTTLQIELLENCQTMAEVFLQSKLVVSAAGGTQFELLACATPAMLVVAADNQVNATVQAIEQGWCESIDCRLLVGSEQQLNIMSKIANKIECLYQQPQQLADKHLHALNYKQVNGADNVLECMLGLANKAG